LYIGTSWEHEHAVNTAILGPHHRERSDGHTGKPAAGIDEAHVAIGARHKTCAEYKDDAPSGNRELPCQSRRLMRTPFESRYRPEDRPSARLQKHRVLVLYELCSGVNGARPTQDGSEEPFGRGIFDLSRTVSLKSYHAVSEMPYCTPIPMLKLGHDLDGAEYALEADQQCPSKQRRPRTDLVVSVQDSTKGRKACEPETLLVVVQPSPSLFPRVYECHVEIAICCCAASHDVGSLCGSSVSVMAKVMAQKLNQK
jgi:hypothetical protein